jgi:hypothetical protein
MADKLYDLSGLAAWPGCDILCHETMVAKGKKLHCPCRL